MLLAACGQQQTPVAKTPPPPSSPRIEGKLNTVSSADIRAAIAVIRAHIRKEYGISLAIYKVYVIDHNNMSFQYWQHDTETYNYVKRARGRWQMDDQEAERMVVPGVNIPTG